jgi:hypothetical protein
MSARQLSWSVALLVLAVALLIRNSSSGQPGAAAVPGAKDPSSSSASHRLTGTASCSGRACHGGLDARTPSDGQTILQNEYPKWLMHDRHATAYEVLFDERSKRIAQNLGIGQAHESVRCLACHTNPLAALDQSPLAHEERASGVGCEACHGPASDWLDQHTALGWGQQVERARERGMTPIGDLPAWAATCAGCHVGAPADTSRGLPLRDVNHDLIAAGHPRLDFEFGAFLANVPPHWRKKEREPGYEAKVWAVGQALSAEAAVRLLEYRADPSPAPDRATKPWPEFAEYACYACHHDLMQVWRQTKDHYSGRRPGSLPWGTWYLLPLANPLEGHALTQDGKPVIDRLKTLREVMEQPYPSRENAAVLAKAIAGQLRTWGEQLAAKRYDEKRVRALATALADDGRSVPDWDAATQFYLALAALCRALPKQEQAAFEAPLKGMYEQLEAPFQRGRLHSPLHFDPTPPANKGSLAELEKIRELLKGR